MTALSRRPSPAWPARRPLDPTGPARHVVERNVLSYRRLWRTFVAGFLEPVFYLVGLGVGLGQLVGDVEVDGRLVSYAAFVAPGLIASSAMNGAVFDSTFNFYFKLRYAKTFDAMLSTPLSLGDIVVGELAWAMLRGGIYAVGFLVVMVAMGLVESWWAVFVVPAALLVGLAFAAVGTALTTFMRSWHDFDYIQLVLQPLFLCSTTFFPLSVYPDWAQPLVQATPLYHGVVLCRSLTLGVVDGPLLFSVVYLVVMALAGAVVARRRMGAVLLT